jgi:hypothetical protein
MIRKRLLVGRGVRRTLVLWAQLSYGYILVKIKCDFGGKTTVLVKEPK